jgi:hypothetical protein
MLEQQLESGTTILILGVTAVCGDISRCKMPWAAHAHFTVRALIPEVLE